MEENNECIIRKVESKDMIKFMPLYKLATKWEFDDIFARENLEEKIPTEEEFAKHFNNSDVKVCYVAEIKDEIIGLMVGDMRSPMFVYGNKKFACLSALYINPNCKNMGIVAKFKDIFKKWAKDNNADSYVIGILKP